MKEVYKSKNVRKHLRLFQFDPKTQDSDKWEKLREEYKSNPEVNILTLVDKYYGLTTAPAFSDHINDSQPPWSDVTLDFIKITQKEIKSS